MVAHVRLGEVVRIAQEDSRAVHGDVPESENHGGVSSRVREGGRDNRVLLRDDRGSPLNHPTNSRALSTPESASPGTSSVLSPSHPYANIVPSYLGREKKVRERVADDGDGSEDAIRSTCCSRDANARGVAPGDELGDGDVAAELDVAEEADSRVGENAVEAVRHGLGARVVGRDAGSDEPEGVGRRSSTSTRAASP